MKTYAIYPGTFDPVTNGHLNLIERMANMFDYIVVGVAASPSKHPMFTLQERVNMITEAIKPLTNVHAEGFSGLLVDFAKEKGANLLIRGLRTTVDFEYELGLTNMYKKLAPCLESVFLPPSSDYAFLSSTMVREVAIHGGTISDFVPPCVINNMKEKMHGKAS